MSGKTQKLLRRFTHDMGYNTAAAKAAKQMLRKQNTDNRTILLKEMRQFENERAQEIHDD